MIVVPIEIDYNNISSDFYLKMYDYLFSEVI